VIDEPVIRLTSADLSASADVSSIAEVFDFPRDYPGLLKAGIIASGIVPPGIEGTTHPWPFCWNSSREGPVAALKSSAG
jgi:hypothetical protein